MDVQGTQELTETNGRKQDAPFAQLPNELLIPIFIEASFEPSLVWRIIRTPGKRPREEGAWRYCNMEVVISHVCQQWRYVSLGVPALWTTFYYIDDCRSNPREILQRLDAYLERSGTQLLDIWIDLRAGRRNLVDRNQSLITKTIVHINRWRSFHFFPHYVPALLLTFLTQLKDLAAPNLETFCTSADITGELIFALGLPMTGGSANTPSSSTIFKKGAPKLSVLSMDNSGFFVNLLPLSNASILYIFHENPPMGVVPALSWLRSMDSLANLTHLTLDRVFIAAHPSSSLLAPYVVFPNLMHFRLCNQIIRRSEFGRFHFPCLETLTFYKINYQGGEGVYRPVDIPNLHSLFLVDSKIDDNGISLTRLTSTITTIVLSDSRMPSAVIQPMELLDYDHTKKGWPMLQDITVNLRNLEKYGLEFYLRCFQTRPKVPPITLRIDSNLLADWQTRFADRLALLEDLCTIETLDASNPYIPSPWPIDTFDGPFRNLYKKSDPPLIRRYSTHYSNI